MRELAARILVPLCCGLAGGAVVLLFAPRPTPSAATPDADVRELRERLVALQRAVDELRFEEPRPEAAARPAAGAEPPEAESSPARREMVEEVRSTLERLRAGREARSEQRRERERARAADALAEAQLVGRNTSDAETHANVLRWLKGLGFEPEQEARIAAAAAPYVKNRHRRIVELLEGAARGSPPGREKVEEELGALARSAEGDLGFLDDTARAAVLARIHARVRVPLALELAGGFE